jgi:hypothetical protein
MKKLILLGILLLIVIPFPTLALEWDNIKSYDTDTRTITITNSLVKLIPTTTVATIKLDTPLIVNTFTGYQKVAEFTIDSKNSYDSFYNNMDFFDINKNDKEVNREFDFKIKTVYLEEIDDYKTSCKTRDVYIESNSSYIKIVI